jgi:molecular chaperone GrpE
MTQMKEIFEKLGVTEIAAVGEAFDPERHNAVMHIEDDCYGANEVVEEFEKGFMLGDRVIRFSAVKVAN